jgi:hypothetical protein
LANGPDAHVFVFQIDEVEKVHHAQLGVELTSAGGAATIRGTMKETSSSTATLLLT